MREDGRLVLAHRRWQMGGDRRLESVMGKDWKMEDNEDSPPEVIVGLSFLVEEVGWFPFH